MKTGKVINYSVALAAIAVAVFAGLDYFNKRNSGGGSSAGGSYSGGGGGFLSNLFGGGNPAIANPVAAGTLPTGGGTVGASNPPAKAPTASGFFCSPIFGTSAERNAACGR